MCDDTCAPTTLGMTREWPGKLAVIICKVGTPFLLSSPPTRRREAQVRSYPFHHSNERRKGTVCIKCLGFDSHLVLCDLNNRKFTDLYDALH